MGNERLSNLIVEIEQTGEKIEIESADPKTMTEELLAALSEELNSPSLTKSTLIQKSTSNVLGPAQTLKSAGIRDGETLQACLVKSEIGDEEHRQKQYNRLMLVVIGCYIAGIAVVLAMLAKETEAGVIIPPLYVLAAGAMGSLLVTVDRFLNHSPGKIGDEVQWVIARAVKGILMGALVYFALISGVAALTLSTGVSFEPQKANPYLLFFIAFLGSFSEEFFQAVITDVIKKLTTQQQGGPPSQGGNSPVESNTA